MVSLLGEAAFAGFPNVPAEQQRSRVERFDKYESSLIAHMSTAAQEAARTAMRAEAQSVTQANPSGPASYAARQGTTKPVRMSVPTFDGKEADSLVFWIREIEIALSAGQIYESRAQVAFALSNLGGRARAWAMAREREPRGRFQAPPNASGPPPSYSPYGSQQQQQQQQYGDMGPRVGYDRQYPQQYPPQQGLGGPFMPGKRKVDAIPSLRTLRQPKPFNDAVHIAMLEDHCVRSAQGYTGRAEATEGPTPMEISSAESARPQRNQRTSGRCFGCNQLGHFCRNCPTNLWKAGRGKAAPLLNVIESAVSENGDSQYARDALLGDVAPPRASVKGYDEPLKFLIDSGASYNFATKASVVRNSALYASALEASKRNTNVSVRLATGSIVSTRKVRLSLNVNFDDFNSVEPFIVLDMDDRYDLILGMPWLAKHEPWIDWRSRTIGASHKPLADRALAGHVPSSSRDGFVHEHRVPRGERHFAGTSEVLGLPSAMSTASSTSSRAHEPSVDVGEDMEFLCAPQDEAHETLKNENVAFAHGAGGIQSVRAAAAHAGAVARAGARARTCGRAETPTSEDAKAGTSTPGLRLGVVRRNADPSDRVVGPTVLDVLTGEYKDGGELAILLAVADLLELEELSYVEFLDSLKAGELEEMVLIRRELDSIELNTSSVMDPEVLENERSSSRQKRYVAAILKDPSDPYYPLLKEFSDVVSDNPPSVLPPDRGVRHEIDLVPVTKSCTTRQWPLPKEQVDVIDAFFAAKYAAGMWRMIHAFNKLNAATIPASTPIPRKDVLQNNVVGCTIFSALDMVDGYYQLLMRESDVPLTAVSTPSGMLWEWLVMPQRLSNAPATFNRLVTQHVRPMRQFVQTYFDHSFVPSRTSGVYLGAEEIPFLGCFLGKDGVRADPEKICAIAQWPVPVSQKDLRKWLGLANYLHKYSANYAEMARPLTNLLKKKAEWSCDDEAQQAFESIKSSLQSAPILALPDDDRPFSVVCDASDFAISCALLQVEADGRERVVSFQSRQLKAAEKNYPVHDKELLAMKYALVTFQVLLLGSKPFVIYTDYASLRTATSSPHLSQRMARWLSFFAEYNFTVEYKPGKPNVLADALSRRPDYELAHVAYLESPLYELLREAYAEDVDLADLVTSLKVPETGVQLTARQRLRLHRYSLADDLLYYQVDESDEPRIVVPNDENLRHRVLYEAHDTPLSGHLGREKTYTSVARNFWWPDMYKWVRTYVQTCETCQRVKHAPSSSAPLMRLLMPADCWRSVSMDFIFELPADTRGHTGILVFVCRLSKMVRLVAVK
uniref:CCHC-type domain-containing protein n=1 Tax=Phytophthora ramorum TaxID=164328 RepID=H3H363_PHYRM